MRQTIQSQIVADSINPQGDRITSFVLDMPRIILAELNTHRVFTRNSASSRAIPFNHMFNKVTIDPFVPKKWMLDHSGMQGNDYFAPGSDDENKAIDIWLQARADAAYRARQLSQLGVTKQLCNRLLEPFLWHKVLVTATEFENFFALRAHEAAEIHIAELAENMLLNYNQSVPRNLEPGQWHIPFGDNFDETRIAMALQLNGHLNTEALANEYRIKVATARCARISYNDFNGNDDYEADIKLHDRLASMGHWSPFEHCARTMSEAEYYEHYRANPFQNTMPYNDDKTALGWSGNFKGFIQYRKMFGDENRNDNRVIKRRE